MENTTNNITVMLNQWIAGDTSVENDLIAAVYPLLRDIAHTQLRKTPNSAVHTTVMTITRTHAFSKQQSSQNPRV